MDFNFQAVLQVNIYLSQIIEKMTVMAENHKTLLEHEIDEKRNKVEELKRKNNEQEEEKSELVRQNCELDRKYSELQVMYSECQRKNGRLESDLDEKRNEIEELERKNNEQKEETSELVRLIEELSLEETKPSCPVCLENFDTESHQPYALSCPHMVCAQCLYPALERDESRDNRNIRGESHPSKHCPICRTRVNTPLKKICL